MTGKRVPGYVPPQLPVPAATPPEGSDWIHEIKFDGFRTQAAVRDGSFRFYSRRGHDWTRRYGKLGEEAALLADEALIDGEMLMLDADGAPSFSALQRAALSDRPVDGLIFMAFDLLLFDGKDLRNLELEARRDILRRLVRPGGRIQFSESLDMDPSELFAQAQRAGLEGVVSKKRGSRYRSGPSRSWTKAKCYSTETFDVSGLIRQPGKPTMAIVSRDGRYVGSAFVTLPAIRERLMARVRKGAKAPPGFRDRPGASYIPPGTRADVRFLRGEESLRHATVRSIDGQN